MSALKYGQMDRAILADLLREIPRVCSSMVEALYHMADKEAILLPDEMSQDLLRIFALRNKCMEEHIFYSLGCARVDPELSGTKALRAERRFAIIDDVFVRQLNLECRHDVCIKAKEYVGKIVVYGIDRPMNDLMMTDSQGLSVTVFGPSDNGFSKAVIELNEAELA